MQKLETFGGIVEHVHVDLKELLRLMRGDGLSVKYIKVVVKRYAKVFHR